MQLQSQTRWVDVRCGGFRDGSGGCSTSAKAKLGISFTPAPRSVVAAASGGLQAIDRVYLDIRNPAGLEKDTQFARDLGFTGKALIHPGQIEVVESVFRPTDAEVEYARRVVEAFEAAEATGAGAVAVDGQMVDLPVVERAPAGTSACI